MINSSIYQLIILAFLLGSANSSDAQISVFPYSESFEAGMGLWHDMDWKRDQAGTPSRGTGPAVGNGSAWFIYTEVSGTNLLNKRSYLEAEFDFTGELNPQLTFVYHMFGGNLGELHVDVFTVIWYACVWSMIGEQHAVNAGACKEANVDLTAYENRGGVRIQFRAASGTNWDGDIAIDDVSVCAKNTGTATISTNMMSAAAAVDLTLTEKEGGATVQWQESNDNLVFTNIGGATAVLAAGSSYYYRLAALSGCAKYSNVVSVSVTDGAGTINIFPYSEGFEAGLRKNIYFFISKVRNKSNIKSLLLFCVLFK
jgi:hypothetical protein